MFADVLDKLSRSGNAVLVSDDDRLDVGVTARPLSSQRTTFDHFARWLEKGIVLIIYARD